MVSSPTLLVVGQPAWKLKRVRTLLVDHFQLRRYGNTRISWVQKLLFGLIKSGHHGLWFSDRDVAAFEAPFGWKALGRKHSNRRLIEMVDSAEPDLLIVGHCDIITNDTLVEIRRLRPSIRIAHCNVDAIFVPDNAQRIRNRSKVCDTVFVSTGVKDLAVFQGARAKVLHMPNAVDASVECLRNDESSALDIDLLFCSGSNAFTRRLEMVGRLRESLRDELEVKVFGGFGEAPIWGRKCDHILARSRMGLNLNRQEGYHWYSSDRMAQLGGNGILPFTHFAARFEELFPTESVPYFKDEDDLLRQVRDFGHDDAKRRHWAARTREFFHRNLNSTLQAQYIVETSFDLPLTQDYVWTSG